MLRIASRACSLVVSSTPTLRLRDAPRVSTDIATFAAKTTATTPNVVSTNHWRRPAATTCALRIAAYPSSDCSSGSGGAAIRYGSTVRVYHLHCSLPVWPRVLRAASRRALDRSAVFLRSLGAQNSV